MYPVSAREVFKYKFCKKNDESKVSRLPFTSVPSQKLEITFFQPSPEVFWDDVTAANDGSDLSDCEYEITEFQWTSSSAPDFNVSNVQYF